MVRVTGEDPTAPPDIQLNFLSHPDDMKLTVEGIRMALDLLRGPHLKGFVEQIVSPTPDAEASDEGLRQYARQTAGTGFHPVGTAKMGAEDDPTAVCDQHGTVRGVGNLRVADASLMPLIVTGPTNLTSIMIGERIAHWLTTQSD